MNIQFTHCNACQSNNFTELFRTADTLTDDPTEFPVVRCNCCGLQYTNPRPDINDISRYYGEEFVSYQFEFKRKGDSSTKERLVSFITETSAKKKVRITEQILRINKESKIIDIGCGRQLFLKILQEKYNCETTGLDFDKSTIDYCRNILGINALQGGSSLLPELNKKFDLITMWHYLEHEYDPLAALRFASDALSNEGRLIIEVPNANSLENKIFGKKSYLYDIPRHLYHFSEESLNILLEKAGLEIIQISYPTLSGGYVGSLQNILFKGKIYKNLKDNIYIFFLLTLLSIPLEIFSSKTKQGSIMNIACRRFVSKSA